MTPLDLSRLFNPKFDRLRPRLTLVGRERVSASLLNGRQVVFFPVNMNGKLAYLIGVVIGDGYLSKPIDRKSHGTGFHWKLVITGTREYVFHLRQLFLETFGLLGGVIQDERKANAWQLRFGSLLLHRFFSRVIGLPMGRKTTHGAWSNLELVDEFPFYFLAGLIDSDGHIGRKYIGIIQKRFRFLTRVRRFALRNTGMKFNGPHVNSRKKGKVVSWIISVSRLSVRQRLLKELSELDLG